MAIVHFSMLWQRQDGRLWYLSRRFFTFEAQNQQDPTLAIPPSWAGH
jgi:hypothetical protein